MAKEMGELEVGMAIAHLAETDMRVRDSVLRQLEWDPQVDASAIGVAAKDRAVTLTGYIDTYSGKLAAERAAKRVRGVRAVANEIEVRPKLERTDADIALDAVRSLELRSTVPDSVQATVHHGHVTLTGKALWEFQRRDAKAVRHIRRCVASRTDRSRTDGGLPRRSSPHRQALHLSADLDARHIVRTCQATPSPGIEGTWLQRTSRAQPRCAGHQARRQRITVQPPMAGTSDLLTTSFGSPEEGFDHVRAHATCRPSHVAVPVVARADGRHSRAGTGRRDTDGATA
jgi:osmotically-inducible protein OsmY